jgi:outer membrane protein
MYKYVFLNLLFCMNLQAQTQLNLDDCIALAIKNNFQIKQSEMQVESGINQYNQTKFSQLPAVAGILNQGYNLGRTIDPYSNDIVTNQIGTNNMGVRADWVVFNGFQNKKQLEQQMLQLKASKYDVENAKNTIKLNVILAYMQILSANELLEVAQNQAVATKLQLEKVEKLVKLNVTSESNLYDIKAQLASDEFQITNAKNNYRSAKLRLKQLLNISSDKDINFEGISLENIQISPNLQIQSEVLDFAENNFPEIKAGKTRLLAYQKGIEIINNMKFPTITLSGAWGTSYSSAAKKAVIGENLNESFTNQYININNAKIPVMQIVPDVSTQKIGFGSQLGNNNNLSLGLNVRIPIFNTTQQKYRLENVKIQQKIAKNETENTRLQLQQAIEQAFIDRNNAAERYESLQNQLIALEKAFQVAEIKLSTGIINPIDYTITKTNFDKAKANAVQAKYEYFFRVKIVDFYQGK